MLSWQYGRGRGSKVFLGFLSLPGLVSTSIGDSLGIPSVGDIIIFFLSIFTFTTGLITLALLAGHMFVHCSGSSLKIKQVCI